MPHVIAINLNIIRENALAGKRLSLSHSDLSLFVFVIVC